MELIRVWKNIPVSEIDNHLLIVDDLSGFCQNCRNPGIKYSAGISKCPNCGAEFKYVTTREAANSPLGQKILQKIHNVYADTTIIDFQDYKHLSDKKKAHSLFSNNDEGGN